MGKKEDLVIKKLHYKLIASVLVVGGFLFVPALASAATATTTITSSIGAGINLLTTSGSVDISATPNGTGVQTTASDTVTVSTNDSAGYTLKLAETSAQTELKDNTTSSTIPAIGGTQTAPIALTANTWGYRVDGVGNFGGTTTTSQSNGAIGAVKYAAVPATASPDTLKTTTAVATNETTTVWYSVAVNTSTASGTYTNGVTYTAVTNT